MLACQRKMPPCGTLTLIRHAATSVASVARDEPAKDARRRKAAALGSTLVRGTGLLLAAADRVQTQGHRQRRKQRADRGPAACRSWPAPQPPRSCSSVASSANGAAGMIAWLPGLNVCLAWRVIGQCNDEAPALSLGDAGAGPLRSSLSVDCARRFASLTADGPSARMVKRERRAERELPIGGCPRNCERRAARPVVHWGRKAPGRPTRRV
jgi:hypothetical protein